MVHEVGSQAKAGIEPRLIIVTFPYTVQSSIFPCEPEFIKNNLFKHSYILQRQKINTFLPRRATKVHTS